MYEKIKLNERMLLCGMLGDVLLVLYFVLVFRWWGAVSDAAGGVEDVDVMLRMAGRGRSFGRECYRCRFKPRRLKNKKKEVT
jgi:hypothetical protein